jgi:hypothetical protein
MNWLDHNPRAHWSPPDLRLPHPDQTQTLKLN